MTERLEGKGRFWEAVQFEAVSCIRNRIISERECSMAKQRGYADQRRLWAESDSIAEQFVPSERYKAQQRAMAQTLLAAGLNPEQIASMLSVPEDFSSTETPKDETAAGDRPQEDS
jgi:hypothetical protein